VRREPHQTTQVEPPVGQGDQKLRTLPCRPGHLDALVGGVLGQTQLPDAVLPHRGVARWEIEPTDVDLRDVGEHLGRRDAILEDERVAEVYLERPERRSIILGRNARVTFMRPNTFVSYWRRIS